MLAIALALYIPFATKLNVRSASQTTKLSELTLLQGALSSECRLIPAPSVRAESGNSLRAGLWGSLPITTNPWIGKEPRVIASIYVHMFGPPVTPNGPPLDARSLSRYAFELAKDVEEGYAAFYQQSGQPAIAVYALKFRNAVELPSHAPKTRNDDRLVRWIELGQLVVLAVGYNGDCSRPIETHLESLVRKK